MRGLICLILLVLGLPAWARKEAASPHGPLELDCATCHATSGWSLKDAPDFEHGRDGHWPLEGVHQVVGCAGCHVELRFKDTPTTCAECHLDPHQGSLGNTCTECHTPDRWLDRARMKQRHDRSLFPLTGAHRDADCAQCHVGEGAAQFAGTPTDCAGCHAGDFLRADSPDHALGGLPTTCKDCHSTNRWSATGSFTHAGYALEGAHADPAGARCVECHGGSPFQSAPTTCDGCHLEDWTAAREPSHRAADFSHDCASCHDGTATTWRPAAFNHQASTGWALAGAHTQATCVQCHTGERYAGTGNVCVDCHLEQYQSTTMPAHQRPGYPQDCSLCHTTTQWPGSPFDHQRTSFPLEGSHRSVACSSCHSGWEAGDAPQDGKYLSTPTDCYACHQLDYMESREPAHSQGQFPRDCTQCHKASAWNTPSFDHQSTEFPLTESHRWVGCAHCHENGLFQGTSTACFSCHERNFAATTQPDHENEQIPRDCALCHTRTAWNPSTLDHDLTAFPLTGSHASTSCGECHVNGEYQVTPTDCWSCHQTNFDESADPDHAAAQFPHDCTVCHNTVHWTDAIFDHDATEFPLTGAHVGVTCAECHQNGQYADLPGTCWNCHESSYAQTTDPDHVTPQFPHDCTLCHTTTSYRPSTFDHQTTDFPLTGAHVGVTCAECHQSGQYADLPGICWNCHESSYNQTTDPDHVTPQFPHDCTLCHTTTSYRPSTFDHQATDFPLTGAHLGVTCAQCHQNGQYTDLPGTCWNCHESSYNQTTDPDHVTPQFPHDCTLCHTTTSYRPSTFDHGEDTSFPLTGAHTTVTCAQCHVNGQYVDLPAACWDCHEPDYRDTTNPDHETGQYPQDCAVCHSTIQWEGAVFNHDVTGYPLTGAHTSVSCAQCHVNGQYEGTPSDCWSCHQADYQSVTNPNHVTGQYPHDCTTCHTTVTWDGATFNHNTTDFPLTGAHTTVSCALCHVGGVYDGTPTDCYSCHDADYGGVVTPDHEGEGYPVSCSMCHTTTAGWNSNWNHASWFPIYTGNHRNEWTTCASCHLNNDLTDFSCTHCHEHRQSAMNSEHDDVNGYTWESHACLNCHPDGSEFAGPRMKWEGMDTKPRNFLR